MDIGEVYSEGLLKASIKDILEFYKKIGYFSLYLLPFVGFAIEYSKPKEKRTRFGKIIADLGIAVPLIKLAMIITPYVISKNYKKNLKNEKKIEQTIEKENNLEKSINYQEILK